MDLPLIPYNRKLSTEKKTFTNFVVLEPPVKVFYTKFGRAIPTYPPVYILGIISMHDRGKNVLVFGFPGDQGTI